MKKTTGYFNRIKNKFEFFLGHNRLEKGKENTISFGQDCQFRNCCIIVHGRNNKLIFGNNNNMSGLRILIEGENNIIEFGKNVTINAAKTQPTVVNAVGGTSISIGDGSLLSNNIEIHSTDYHGIYDKDGVRVNPDKNILIGQYVWIGLGSKILKGTTIADGSIVGAGSVVTRQFREENVVIAGNPAKIIKYQVFWKKTRKETYPVPNVLKEKWNSKVEI